MSFFFGGGKSFCGGCILLLSRSHEKGEDKDTVSGCVAEGREGIQTLSNRILKRERERERPNKVCTDMTGATYQLSPLGRDNVTLEYVSFQGRLQVQFIVGV